MFDRGVFLKMLQNLSFFCSKSLRVRRKLRRSYAEVTRKLRESSGKNLRKICGKVAQRLRKSWCYFFFGGRPDSLRVMKVNSRRKTYILSIFMMHFQVKLTITHVILKTSSFNESTALFSSPLYEQLWTQDFHRSTQNSKIKATEKNARARKKCRKERI